MSIFFNALNAQYTIFATRGFVIETLKAKNKVWRGREEV